ncbi:MAG: exonuclease SbcCD subunit D C-terminal domain-containing protein [Synergistaceae bacterium]|nr:exonuclease SbcCD subunit D C-terminal domain-containing protein [Synergistaceae bacterium]
MRILHTSDWHIGRKLKDKDRSDEFIKFFKWLNDLISSEKIDVLLVAGDIFDNTTPSIQAQNIYYSFLTELAKSSCRHCVIISGNHDSPAFIDAPSGLLKYLNIHVVGRTNITDEVIKLQDPDLIVCAVPYLRDRDVREANDEINSIDEALKQGISKHYETIFYLAKRLQAGSNIPIIAMGHLFARGGRVKQDDGTRSLYVGTSIEIGSEIFPDDITYTALGHLHSPQIIGGRENVRYSGSPLAMGFGEAGTQKAVCIIDIDANNNLTVKDFPVPEFQKINRVSGDIQEIAKALKYYASMKESIWLDVTYTGNERIGDLAERLNNFTQNYPYIEILSVHNEGGRSNNKLESDSIPETLENISPVKMFEMCLESNNIPEEQQKIFMPLYQEILHEMGINY